MGWQTWCDSTLRFQDSYFERTFLQVLRSTILLPCPFHLRERWWSCSALRERNGRKPLAPGMVNRPSNVWDRIADTSYICGAT
jgi:hypothetical protein